MNQPLFLKTGNKIGIICSAGYLNLNDIHFAVNYFTNAGFKVITGKTIGAGKDYFAGTDDLRKAELQEFLDNPEIHAVIFARGGYGTVRIIDQVDFSGFVKNPKWLVGFSDMTILQNHIIKNFNIPVIHGPMAKTLRNNKSALYLMEALSGNLKFYSLKSNQNNHPGIAEGEIIGGNLSILNSITGSKSDFDPAGKILFLEETGEYYYQIDRMLWTLGRSKDLSRLKGIIVGNFSRIKDTRRSFGRNIYQVINEHFGKYNLPIMFGFPAGHYAVNHPFYMGIRVKLQVSQEKCRIDFL